MKKVRLIGLIFIVLLGALALVFNGCGGGGGGGTGGGGTTPPSGTPINNPTQASQAAGTGYQAVNTTLGTAEFIDNIGGLSSLVGGAPQFKFSKAFKPDPGMAKAIRLSGKLSRSRALMTVSNAIKRAKMMKTQVPINGTESCQDGGSYTYSGTVDDTTGSFDITFTFTNCRENNFEINGPLRLRGTLSESSGQMNIILGSQSTPFTILEFSDNYATRVSQMTLVLTMDRSSSQSRTTLTSHSTTNGQVDVNDYLSHEDYQMSFNNFKEDFSGTCSDQQCSQVSVADTFNGGFRKTWTENNVPNSVSLSYSNFRLSVISTAQYLDYSIDGTVNVDFTPDKCFEGTYVFETRSPFRDDMSRHETISGHLVINGNTHIEVTQGQLVVWYDANGNGRRDSGEVIASGGEEVLYNLAEQCAF